MATSSYEWKRLERERRTPFIQTSMNELKITDKLKAFFLSFVYCMVSKYKRQIWVSDQPQTVCKNVCVGIPPIITDGCSSRTLARLALDYVGEHVIETVLLTVLVHYLPCTIPSSSFFFIVFRYKPDSGELTLYEDFSKGCEYCHESFVFYAGCMQHYWNY